MRWYALLYQATATPMRMCSAEQEENITYTPADMADEMFRSSPELAAPTILEKLSFELKAP